MAENKQLNVLISCFSGVLASVLVILQLNGVLLMRLLQQQKYLQQLYHKHWYQEI